jgi:hypothetical protein
MYVLATTFDSERLNFEGLAKLWLAVFHIVKVLPKTVSKVRVLEEFTTPYNE